MARNARDTPSGYNLSNHWRHPPDSLTTVAPQLVTAVTSMARSRLLRQPVYRRSVLRLTTMTG